MEVLISFENEENKWFIFKVENSFSDLALLNETNAKHGIGIQNVKRRLELLFKKRFEFSNTIRDQKYCIQLKIPIE